MLRDFKETRLSKTKIGSINSGLDYPNKIQTITGPRLLKTNSQEI
jgi:hypothetical protein